MYCTEKIRRPGETNVRPCNGLMKPGIALVLDLSKVRRGMCVGPAAPRKLEVVLKCQQCGRSVT